MLQGRWSYILFAMIATPLAVYDDLEGIILIAGTIAGIFDLVLTFYHFRGLSRIFLTLCGVGLLLAIRIFEQDSDTYPSVARVNQDIAGIVIALSVLRFGFAAYCTARQRQSTVIRTYVYLLFTCMAQVLGVIQVQEIARLVVPPLNCTLANTTGMTCVANTTSVSAILFEDNMYTDTCPTRVWEHIRMNALFMSQLYVCYVLSTELQHDVENDRKHDVVRGQGYTLGTLALLECTAVVIAAAIQFDRIEESHMMSQGVAIVIALAILLHVVRRVAVELYRSPSDNTQSARILFAIRAALIGDQAGIAHYNVYTPASIKLKL